MPQDGPIVLPNAVNSIDFSQSFETGTNCPINPPNGHNVAPVVRIPTERPETCELEVKQGRVKL